MGVARNQPVGEGGGEGAAKKDAEAAGGSHEVRFGPSAGVKEHSLPFQCGDA